MTDPLLAAAADLPLETIPAGGVFIEEGTDPGRLLVLVSGEVTVEREGVPFARIDRPGAIFGEMAAVLASPPRQPPAQPPRWWCTWSTTQSAS